ncbi:hypothetical protein AJ87_09175 [Rhizobium yanglingense]|nr:hypothetical protein AJ87_09175 [Rhizobium yanglingense]
MSCAVIAGFETMNAASSGVLTDNIFSLVPVFFNRRRQPLALDWKECIELRVSTAINHDIGPVWSRDQIHLAAFFSLVLLLNPELQEIPPARQSRHAVHMRTKLSGERCFRSGCWSVGSITPSR